MQAGRKKRPVSQVSGSYPWSISSKTILRGSIKMAKEPQIVHSFPKNPLEEVRSSVTVFKGKQYVDIRIYYKGDDGDFHPSKKGLTLSIDLFPELETGMQKLKEALEDQ
jgi:hypothetical protein